MAKKEVHKQLQVLPFKDYELWLSWLEKNHTQHNGIWIKFAKKDSGIPSITYEQAREGAIIYGWIDGLINSFGDHYYLRKFTPRRAKSIWSKINREIAESLIKARKMQPSGLAQVKAAQKDGRWKVAYDSQSMIKVPPELQKLLNKNPKAKKFFETISKANRYAFLGRIHNAVKPETRQRHVDKAMEMLIAGEVYYPSVKKKK